MKKGKLIVVEGADGAGKETQTNLLRNFLKNKNFKVGGLSFPRYKETVGGKLLSFSLGKDENKPEFQFSKLDPLASSLLYAMDRYESKDEVKKLLEENDFLVLDRYYTANILHQGAKFEDEEKRKEYIEDNLKIELNILKIPKPDFVLYLDLPYEISLKRLEERQKVTGNSKDLVEQDLEYIKNSIERGRDIAKFCGWTLISSVINKEGEVRELSREEISNTIAHKVEEKFLKEGQINKIPIK